MGGLSFDELQGENSRLNSQLSTRDYGQARVNEINARTERYHQIIAKEGGKLLEADVAIPGFCRLAVDLKTRLLSIPAATAALANPKDPALAQRVITQAIHDALRGVDEQAVERALRGE